MTHPPSFFHFFGAEQATASGDFGRQHFDDILKLHGNPDDVVQCPFCNTTVQHWCNKITYDNRTWIWRNHDFDIHWYHLVICERCGWWRYHFVDATDWLDPWVSHKVALLRRSNLTDASLPLEELSWILREDWKYARHISAKQAEDLVANVFAEHLNCDVHYISNGVFSKDGGIDFVLISRDCGIEYAFQVKRRYNGKAERVHAVREFIGSIAMSPYNKAYYVTTADRFTSSALAETDNRHFNLQTRGIDINLVSGTIIHDLLLQQKSLPVSLTELQKDFAKTSGWKRINQGSGGVSVCEKFNDSSDGSSFASLISNIQVGAFT